MPKQWQESGPEPQRWRLWYGARGQQQSWKNHGKGQEKGSKGAKAAGSFPAYDAKPPATVKSKLDKLEPEGIEPADGLVPGMQKALNHARRMEGRLHRLLKDKQTALEQWEQYKKDAQKAFYNEKARFMQAQENFDKEIATAVVAQKEAREQLCAMVDVANNPWMSEEPAIDNEWDRILVDYEEERQGTMNGVLEQALQETKQWLAQTAALAAAHQTELDMKALRMARGRQPHLGANTLPDGPAASGLPGNGAGSSGEADASAWSRCAVSGAWTTGPFSVLAGYDVSQADSQCVPLCTSWTIRGQASRTGDSQGCKWAYGQLGPGSESGQQPGGYAFRLGPGAWICYH